MGRMGKGQSGLSVLILGLIVLSKRSKSTGWPEYELCLSLLRDTRWNWRSVSERRPSEDEPQHRIQDV
jgi:hypothetical protein